MNEVLIYYTKSLIASYFGIILRRVSNHPNVISFYGVTKDSNGDYNMILQYASDGTLREYLMANFTKLQWTDKLCIAKEIALGLLFFT
ncbi:hypothetical protein C2G38_1438890 [Gigaspora rosea]|uniref:Protein kinase domain-containing protein n=1 Tax=Gigaspora rosea TaxID=44941 RepID=A0A397VDI5_9GLOM|nr:hypothetical protein C2G38_1438890 [Gigaspora rosea]